MGRERSEPEWTAEHQNRKRGATTFEMCGWCEYIGCGSFRYDCALSATCNLLPDYGSARERHWDSKCYIRMLGVDDIAAIVQSKGHTIKSAEEKIKSTKKDISALSKIGAPIKPALPGNRPCEYYNVGDVVWIFHEQKWNRGVVVRGYRHNNGCVSYVLDNYPDSKKGWGCGCSVPCVLKEWEYDHFSKHPDDFDVWLDLSDREYNGEKLGLGAYKAAMGREALVSSGRGGVV